MKDHFKELLEYSHYYNLEIIKKFNDGDLHFMIPEKAKSLMSHTMNAQKIWNNRMNAEEAAVGVWTTIDFENMEAFENENHQNSLAVVEREDLDRVVAYKNTKGEHFQNSVKDILFHMINHATYHRGQIATEFRKKGIDPIVSDYVIYKRGF